MNKVRYSQGNMWLGGASLLILAGLTVSESAYAQTTPIPQSQDPTVLSDTANQDASADIIVTAQKRSQKLNDVGISIVAATGAQLQTSGITDVSQLAKIAPGFSVGTSFQGFPVFSLRGVNFNASQFSAPPAVSTYIDEAILPYSPMTSGLLFDVDHIEVLKGPQGTLFGQNATGGSINVIAAKPTSDLSAGFNTEFNNFGQVILGGYVSGPLSDTLRARLAAETTQFGAWQRGYYLYHGKNGDQNRAAGRLLIDWTPTDKLSVNLNINANYDHGQATQFQFGGPILPLGASLAAYPVPTNGRDVELPPGFDTHVHNRLYQGVLRVDYRFSDAVTLTSLSNYVDFKSTLPQSLDAVALPVQNSYSTGNDRTFSQEVHLSGKLLDDRLNYIVGGNYEHDTLVDQDVLDAINFSALPPRNIFSYAYAPKNEQIAAFGNVDFKIVPALTLTAGVRYTSVKETTIGCTSGNAIGAAVLGGIASFVGGNPADYVAGQCLTINDNVPTPAAANFNPIQDNDSRKEHNLSWRAGINYKVAQDSLLYATISRGFKAGLFPALPAFFHSENTPIRQEELTAYEVGAKLDLLKRALRLNLSAFYYDYHDKQFYTYVFEPIVLADSTVVNIPKSSVKGAEFDATITPFKGLTIRAAGTYIKTKIGHFVTTNSSGNLQDVSGSEFNFAPPFSATSDAEYRFPVGTNLHGYVGGDALYNSRTFGNLGEPVAQLIPHYLVAGARVGVESENGWRFGLFVRNLADKYYWTGAFYAGEAIARVPGMPRTFGATAGFKF